MTKISDFRTAITAVLDDKATTYGENVDLTGPEIEEVSRAIDAANETVNPNLPTRPAQ